MKYKILVTAPPILPKIENYKKIFDENNAKIFTPNFKVIESLSAKQLIPLMKDVDGVLCGDDEINIDVLRSANKLKVVSKWGTGIDSIDADSAKKLGIKVMRVKDVFSDPVSDTVLSYILIFCRKILEKNQIVKNNEWKKTESFTLKEKKLGIIGLGHIGMSLAKKAIGLGMKVYGNDIVKKKYESQSLKIVNLDYLLKNSDFISLHTDLNKSTYHLIGKDQLSMMKKDSIIINTSRGAVIDQIELENALSENKIGGAALDVFEEEPLPKNSKLKKFENVLLSPHNSNASIEVFNKVDILSINNIFDFL
tara:strand:+ start:249 stop:1175 length:927 start_codon:yes stop_codon:yes gene_type:complete